MKLFSFKQQSQENFQPVTLEERDKVRSLAGRLIDVPESQDLFNNLHSYCLYLLEEKGIETKTLFFRRITRYISSNQEIDFWIDLRYRKRLFMDSLMLSYNESSSIVNHLHLMREREKIGSLDTKKSFKEQFQYRKPGMLRIMGTNKKYKLIRYR